jgi:RND family efflux transporter MFP subunit
MVENPPNRDDQLRADLASLRLERDVPARGRRKRGWRPGRWIAAVLAVAGLAGAGLWYSTRAIPVTTVRAERLAAAAAGPVPVLSGSGYVVTGERYISIGVRVAGRIDRYFVEEGQSVREGDSLVQLDDRDYRAGVARGEASLALARADLRLAEAELSRGQRLIREQIVSDQELDVLRNRRSVAAARVSQAEAEVEQARVNLEYTLLRSPTDGVVLAKLKEVGEIAVPGGFAGSGDLIRLANLADMRAEVDVNEADLNRVGIGQDAQVTPDAYPDQSYAARVVKMYPQVDRQKGTLKVEVQVLSPDDKLLPDMSARVTFLTAAPTQQEATPSVLVPREALRRDEQGNTVVWVVDGGRTDRVVVETAGDVGGQVRVSRGLSGGEAVVVAGDPTSPGQRVRVAADAEP